jgi:asparagine synthase (glutamine-hydrolysing)
MCQQGGSHVRTFSIGFNEPGYNEAEHAKSVAGHLGTQHTELYVSGVDALGIVPRLASIYDEPFADSSQIPMLLVSQLARRHVTVALSGDGGDELFAGYNRYLLAERAWNSISRLPLTLRKALSTAVLSTSPSTIDALAVPVLKLFRHGNKYGNVGDKLHKFARTVLPALSTYGMYRSLVSQWEDPASVVIGAEEPRTLVDEQNFASELSTVERMSLLDQLTYLPDDILTKVDRAAMSLSLETRVPLLDHRIVEFAWSLPMQQKFRDGKGKWLLRELLYKYVPKALIERPKQGFAIPLEHWLRGPLRAWAEELLSRESLQSAGFFDVAIVRMKWEQHLSGRHNWQHQMWNVLMFQAWYFEVHRPGFRHSLYAAA